MFGYYAAAIGTAFFPAGNAHLSLLLAAYPVLVWLTRAPSLPALLATELWLSFLYASYNGAMVVSLTEIMSRRAPREAQIEPIAQFYLIRGELRHVGGLFPSGRSDLASNFHPGGRLCEQGAGEVRPDILASP